MRIHRVVMHVLAAGGIAVGCLLLVGAPVGAASSVTGRLPASASVEASKVQFVVTYLRIGGKRISEAEATVLVERYGSTMPTMAQVATIGLPQPKANGIAVSHLVGTPLPSMPLQPPTGSVSPRTENAESCTYGAGWYWTSGPIDNGPFDSLKWTEFENWCHNPSINWAGSFSDGGYAYVNPIVAWLWKYSGEGGSFWTRGYEQCGDVFYQQYNFVESWTAGWGPASYQWNWDLTLAGDADGYGWGGDF